MKKILDSWAILAWLQDEKPACDQVQFSLNLAKNGEIELLMNLINVGEVYYRLIRSRDEESANFFWNRLENMPIRLIGINKSLTLIASTLKGKYRISYADAFAAATAITYEGLLITGDPEFREVSTLVEIEWLERYDGGV